MERAYMLIISRKKILTAHSDLKSGRKKGRDKGGMWTSGREKRRNWEVQSAAALSIIVRRARALSKPCPDPLTRVFDFWTASKSCGESLGLQLANTPLGGGTFLLPPIMPSGMPSEGWEAGQTKQAPFALESVISFIPITHSFINFSLCLQNKGYFFISFFICDYYFIIWVSLVWKELK